MLIGSEVFFCYICTEVWGVGTQIVGNMILESSYINSCPRPCLHAASRGASVPATLTCMANLALTYTNQGRWEEAEETQVQVMETFKTKFGADHPDTLTSINNLGLTYTNQGRWEEAEELFVQVMETRKSKLGAHHPDTLTSMNNLAFTWKDQGRHTDALALMEDCAQARQRVLGAAHPLSSLAIVAKWSR